MGSLVVIAALTSAINSIKRCWKYCHQFISTESVNITVHMATVWRKIFKNAGECEIQSCTDLFHSRAARISLLDSVWIQNRFLAADSTKQARVLQQSTSLWDQGSSEVISTLLSSLGKLCLKGGRLSHPAGDRLDLTPCSVHHLYPQRFTCTWIVWDVLPWVLFLLIIWCEAKVTQIISSHTNHSQNTLKNALFSF